VILEAPAVRRCVHAAKRAEMADAHASERSELSLPPSQPGDVRRHVSRARPVAAYDPSRSANGTCTGGIAMPVFSEVTRR
jgi:hypothetical protein